MKRLCSIVLCLGFSLTAHASPSPFGISGSEVPHLLLATHYLDRKEIYYLGQDEIHEVDEDDHHHEAMPKQPRIYDPELYRGQ